MKRILVFLVCLAVSCTLGFAQTGNDQSTAGTDKNKATQAERDAENRADAQHEDDTKAADRAEAAAKVLREISNTPDKGIPNDILKDARCVMVIPGMKKAGFIFGGRYGRGFATCRTHQGWSAPAPVFLGGGSAGLQIGAEGVDLILVVMNDKGVQHLLASKFEIGADASAAAGPVGRSASADTGWKMNSEMLSYSRAKGLFAGVELNGAKLRQDDDTTKQLYGKVIPFKDILSGSVPTPPVARNFVAEVQRDFREARAQQSKKSRRYESEARPER
jgi:SH3 domain-containing YSC84-like protein 1